MVSSSLDETVILWDVQATTAIRKFKGHEGTVQACDISRDNRLVCSCSEDGTVRVGQKILLEYKSHSGCVNPCDIARQSSPLIFSGGSDGMDYPGRKTSCLVENYTILKNLDIGDCVKVSSNITNKISDFHIDLCVRRFARVNVIYKL